jgi:hypothetical protein
MNNFIFLGDFLFQAFEIPEQINIGGSQKLYVHELIGGQRRVDAMGRSDDDLTWTGWFFGELALERALYLDYLRTQGNQLTFQYSQLKYNVVIKEFKCEFQRTSKLPYSITLTVVQDLTTPVTFAIPTDLSQIVNDALIEANQLALLINDGGINAAMAIFNASINAVPSLNNPTADQIASIVSAGQSVEGAVSSAISSYTDSVF